MSHRTKSESQSVPRLPAPRLATPTRLGRRWVLPSGLHRGAARRAGRDRDWVPFPCQGLVRCARHHPTHPDRDRQLSLLPAKAYACGLLIVSCHQAAGRTRPDATAMVECNQPAALGPRAALRPSWRIEKRRSDAISRWVIHYNYRRPHGAAGDKAPPSRVPTGSTKVLSGLNKRSTLVG